MDHTTPLDQLVAAVVGLGGPLTGIVSHMAAFEAAGPPAEGRPPIPEVLHGLLTDVLAGLRDDTPAADLETTARVLDRVVERVCSEILLVDPSGPAGGADAGSGV